MKITRTISINGQVWMEAVERTDNLSLLIEQLIQEWLLTKAKDIQLSETKQLKEEVNKKVAEITKLKGELDKIKKKQPKRIKVIDGASLNEIRN